VRIHATRKKKPRRLRYALKLYVTGITPRSRRTLTNIKQICEANFSGKYKLEVIDLYQHPEVTAQQEIIAAPTLVRTRPLPLRRFIGDMSDTATVVGGLKSA